MPLTRRIKVKSYDLAADFNTASLTAVDTNLSFNGLPNKRYNVRISGTCAKDTGTTGIKIQITAPTGATINKGTYFKGLSAQSTALQNEVFSAINTLNTTAFATVAATVFAFRVEFVIVISSTAGAVKLGVASVTSGTATIHQGTSMEVIESTSV